MQDKIMEGALGGCGMQYSESVHGNDVAHPSELSGPLSQDVVEHSAHLAQRFPKQRGGLPAVIRVTPFLNSLETPFYPNAGIPLQQGKGPGPHTSTSGIDASAFLTSEGQDAASVRFVRPGIREVLGRVEQFERVQGSTVVLDDNAAAPSITQTAPSGGSTAKSQAGRGGQKSGSNGSRKANDRSSQKSDSLNGKQSGGSNDPDGGEDESRDEGKENGKKKKRQPGLDKTKGVRCFLDAYDDALRTGHSCNQRFDEISMLCRHAYKQHDFEWVKSKYLAAPCVDDNSDARPGVCLRCVAAFDSYSALRNHVDGHDNEPSENHVENHIPLVVKHVVMQMLFACRKSAKQVEQAFKRLLACDQKHEDQGSLSDATETTVTTATGKQARKRQSSVSKRAGSSLGAKKQRNATPTAKARAMSSETPGRHERPPTSRIPSLTTSGTTVEGTEAPEVRDSALERLPEDTVEKTNAPFGHPATVLDALQSSVGNIAAGSSSVINPTSYAHAKSTIEGFVTGVVDHPIAIELGHTRDVISQDGMKCTYFPNGTIFMEDLHGRAFKVDSVEGGGLLVWTCRSS